MINVTSDLDSLRIYINTLIHFHLKKNEYIGMQSWIAGTKKKRYYIEIYIREGESITLEYEKIEIWSEILNKLDENL